MKGFGQHLILDGYGGTKKKLESLTLIYSFLDTYPARMGMTKIMPPYVFRYTGVKPEDWGLSGVVLIAESHISIHTFPEKNFLSVDLFSCKEFNTARAIHDIKRLFSLKKIESNVFDRGQEFPKDIQVATNIIYQDRVRMLS